MFRPSLNVTRSSCGAADSPIRKYSRLSAPRTSAALRGERAETTDPSAGSSPHLTRAGFGVVPQSAVDREGQLGAASRRPCRRDPIPSYALADVSSMTTPVRPSNSTILGAFIGDAGRPRRHRDAPCGVRMCSPRAQQACVGGEAVGALNMPSGLPVMRSWRCSSGTPDRGGCLRRRSPRSAGARRGPRCRGWPSRESDVPRAVLADLQLAQGALSNARDTLAPRGWATERYVRS